MDIGIPREIKVREGRVALIPAACGELIRHGHHVMVETGAGVLSGYTDADYRSAGAELVDSAEALFRQATLIVKVKEPQPQEVALLREDQLLFSFLHLAAEPELARGLQESGVTALAFETLVHDGQLPLLAPMSAIAGRIAVQSGACLLQQPKGGRGILLGGVAGAPRGRVAVIGAGTAGGHAVRMAAGIGAEIVVFDTRRERLLAMREIGQHVTTLYPYPQDLAQALETADLVIGAVLITGDRAPHVVSRDMVEAMPEGSVIVDISVDQGGCIETTRPTSWEQPTYHDAGTLHFAVTNMPGAVPRTASQALSAALIPYLILLARKGADMDNQLQGAVNVQGGRIVHPVVAAALA